MEYIYYFKKIKKKSEININVEKRKGNVEVLSKDKDLLQ